MNLVRALTERAVSAKFPATWCHSGQTFGDVFVSFPSETDHSAAMLEPMSADRRKG